MRDEKRKFSVDGLTLNFLANATKIDRLKNVFFYKSQNGNIQMKRLKETDNPDYISNRICDYRYAIHFFYKNKYILFGHLYFGNETKDKKNNTYVWIRVENKIFYLSNPENENYSLLFLIPEIVNEIGLTFNLITTLDIAMDSNKNYSTLIKKAVYNKDFSTIINHKKYNHTGENVDGLNFIYSTNQRRLNNLTVYVKSKDKDASNVKAYNKDKEIEVTNKQYIKEYIGISKPYRLEVEIKNKELTPYLRLLLDINSIKGNDILIQLIDILSAKNNPILEIIFRDFLDKRIHFCLNKKQTPISILNL